jgi:membrane fusion protein, multidrug efflux system
VAATSWQGTQWIIENGLRPGDRVIVDGIQKLIPDGTVRPVAYQPERDTTLAIRVDSTTIAPPSAAPPIQATPPSGARR